MAGMTGPIAVAAPFGPPFGASAWPDLRPPAELPIPVRHKFATADEV